MKAQIYWSGGGGGVLQESLMAGVRRGRGVEPFLALQILGGQRIEKHPHYARIFPSLRILHKQLRESLSNILAEY